MSAVECSDTNTTPIPSFILRIRGHCGRRREKNKVVRGLGRTRTKQGLLNMTGLMESRQQCLPSQDQASQHSSTEERWEHECPSYTDRRKGQVSLRAWPSVGLHAPVEDSTLMSVWEAQIGLTGFLETKRTRNWERSGGRGGLIARGWLQ